jgi:nucleoid-associated protein YgaU
MKGRFMGAARALAGLLVPAALGTASAVLGWAAAAPIGAVRAPGPAPVDALLAVGAVLACAGLLALLAVGAALTLTVAVTGRLAGRRASLAHALTPRLVRATVGLLVGATVVSGPIAVAGAASAYVASSGERPGRTLQLPPGWSPDRPAAVREQADHRHQPAPQARRPATIVVRRGDTLWALAAHHLGPGATNAEVATEWPRWLTSNRGTIGPDPDLILPGQRLRVPIDREESP